MVLHLINQASSAFYSGWLRKNTISFESYETKILKVFNIRNMTDLYFKELINHLCIVGR